MVTYSKLEEITADMKAKWVLGIDLGTTHVKALALDSKGRFVFKRSLTPRIYTDIIGHYEQDPQEILEMVRSVIRECQSQSDLISIGLSGAMHTFIVVDALWRPVTKIWTWMDQRSGVTAKLLRAQGIAEKWYSRTGCPVHSMSPAVKWLHFSRVSGADLRPIALKDWIFYELTGQWATDFSTAAASGMMTLSGEWDEEILHTLQLTPNILPPIHSWDYMGKNVVLGGSDGAIAHYGLNALTDSDAAVLTWGTSAAIRVSTSTTTSQEFMPNGSFAYFMGPGHGFLIGQALSNAGNVLSWIAKVLNMSVEETIQRAVDVIESPESLPRFVPYLFGERSPYWDETLTARFENILPEHGADHLAGGVVLSLLALIVSAYRRLGASTRSWKSVYTGSNLSFATEWGRLIAKLLPVPVYSVQSEDASVLGAAKLAAKQQGWGGKEELDFPDGEPHHFVSLSQSDSSRLASRVDETVAYLYN